VGLVYENVGTAGTPVNHPARSISTCAPAQAKTETPRVEIFVTTWLGIV
jgi:hypothetical protein